VGRNAKLKKKRREKRRREINESWPYFTSRRFLGEVQRLYRDSGANPESSVGCVKVLQEIGDEVGLTIKPISVEVTVYNPTFAAHIEEHGLNPSPEEVHRLGEAGGRYVVLGSRGQKQKDEDNWRGYLVALLTASNKPPTVIDISIGQATRLADGIVCDRPLVFGIPEGFFKGTHCTVGFEPGPNGKICFVYRALPDDTGFESTVDWLRDYGAKAHDKIDFGDMPEETPEEVPEPPKPSGLLGLDGRPLELSGE
jgi:hypothetical protein